MTEIEKKLKDHNHNKYITTPEYNTLAASVFNARLVQANLVTKTDFDAKLSSLNVGNDNYAYDWKSKRLSDETINSIKTSDYGITPYLSYYDFNKIRVNFNLVLFKTRPSHDFSWRNSKYLHCL